MADSKRSLTTNAVRRATTILISVTLAAKIRIAESAWQPVEELVVLQSTLTPPTEAR